MLQCNLTAFAMESFRFDGISKLEILQFSIFFGMGTVVANSTQRRIYTKLRYIDTVSDKPGHIGADVDSVRSTASLTNL
jgi:hypothetical protein